ADTGNANANENVNANANMNARALQARVAEAQRKLRETALMSQDLQALYGTKVLKVQQKGQAREEMMAHSKTLGEVPEHQLATLRSQLHDLDGALAEVNQALQEIRGEERARLGLSDEAVIPAEAELRSSPSHGVHRNTAS